jgi:hypothetical protein
MVVPKGHSKAESLVYKKVDSLVHQMADLTDFHLALSMVG